MRLKTAIERMRLSNGQMIFFVRHRICLRSRHLFWNVRKAVSSRISRGLHRRHWSMNGLQRHINLANDDLGMELLDRVRPRICFPHRVYMKEVSILNRDISMTLLLNRRDCLLLCLMRISKLDHLDLFTKVSFLNLLRNSCRSISLFRMFLQW